MNNVVVVDTSSPWWSKINWTQVVGFACSLLAIIVGHEFSVSAEVQLAIVAVLQAGTALLTVILKTYYTKTISPQSITPEIEQNTKKKLAA